MRASPGPRDSSRLFVAVEIPSATRDQMVAWREEHTASVDRDAFRGLPSTNLHLSLAFLGETPRARICELEGIVARCAREAAPFPVSLVGLGAFPSRGAVRVVWLGVDPVEPLVALHSDLTRHLARAGFPIERRAFRPHVTIAYARRSARRSTRGSETRRRPSDLREEIAGLATEPVGCFTAERLALHESELTPRGALHRTLASCALGVH